MFRCFLYWVFCVLLSCFVSVSLAAVPSDVPPVIATVQAEPHICPLCGKEHSILTVTETVAPEPPGRQGFLKRMFRPFAKRRAAKAARSFSPEQVSGEWSQDQSRAEGEAREMARLDYRSHVADTIGNFEGVGSNCGGVPGTCEPSRRMKRKEGLVLTSDSIASASCPDCSNTRQYRVRSWRSTK